MNRIGSTNLQFFLRLKNFFLNQLFISFKCWFGLRKLSNCTLFSGAYGRIVIFVLFCITFSAKSQQTAIFSQHMFNQLTINPAYAGSSEMVNLFASSRQQWVGAEGGPKTTVFGVDLPVDALGIESGVGLNFNNDQIGFSEEIAVNLVSSVRFRLETGILNAGINLGVVNHVIDPEWYLGDKYGLTDDHSDDDELVFDAKENGSVFDCGIGAFYTWDKGYAGVSVLHLFNPAPKFEDNYYYYLKRTYFISGGYQLALEDKPVVFKPSFLMQTDAASLQADISLLAFYKKRYWGGIGYRWQDAVIVNMGLEMKSGLKIGYSYDIPASRFSRNYGGSHEITLGYQFDMRIDKKGKGYKSVRYL